MKHIAAAAVVIVIVAASYLADVNGLERGDSWDLTAAIALLFFTVLCFRKDN